MDMKIAGSGKIMPGEYGTVSVSGSAQIEGPVRCEALRCAGSVNACGNIECTGRAEIAGSTRLDGVLSAGSVSIAGSFSGTELRGQKDVKIAGSLRLSGGVSGGEVRVGGSAKLAGDLEAETVAVMGVLETPGLVNGETVKIVPAGSDVGAVGGGRITVRRSETDGRGRSRLCSWFGKKPNWKLTVRESIEGDDIELEYTVCPRVSGKRVTVGEGCRIGEVCYSEDCTVSPKAQVEKTTKI